MTQTKALRLALEALESGEKMQSGRLVWIEYDTSLVKEAITAIKAALEAKDEPVAWWIPKHKAPDMVSKVRWSDECEPLYTTPPQRTWVALTDEEREQVINTNTATGLWHMAKDIEALAQPEQESVMILPDGSAFGVMSFRLPDDHWIYAPNEYRDGEYEPIDLPKPILTHQLRDAVVAAVRYAVRGATMRGQETDFDPDALVQNAVYALCGPYTTPPQRKPLTDDQITLIIADCASSHQHTDIHLARAIEQAHGITGETHD